MISSNSISYVLNRCALCLLVRVPGNHLQKARGFSRAFSFSEELSTGTLQLEFRVEIQWLVTLFWFSIFYTMWIL